MSRTAIRGKGGGWDTDYVNGLGNVESAFLYAYLVTSDV